jgi:hypothetical protein
MSNKLFYFLFIGIFVIPMSYILYTNYVRVSELRDYGEFIGCEFLGEANGLKQVAFFECEDEVIMLKVTK